MKNEFNHFKEIQHEPLKAFNRAVMGSNILDTFGPEMAEEYFRPLSQLERRQIYAFLWLIENKGHKYARDIATSGAEFKYDEQ